MVLEYDDLKYNFGCSSIGYKKQDTQKPLGRIPVNDFINKLDSLFNKNDLVGAGKLLDYWHNEAVRLYDKRGELSVVNEELGYFRKTNDKEKALSSVERSIELITELAIENTVSSATIFLNAATTLKAFGKAENALPLYDKTLAIYRANLPANDKLFGGFYNNYGLSLTDLKRYGDAENAFLKAIEVMLENENSKPEIAITYINLAHLYEEFDERSEEDIKICLDSAEEYLYDKDIVHNGYFAFVLSKCAPSFRHFGRLEKALEMEKLSEALYERN